MVITEFHKCVHTLMYTIIGHLILQGMLMCLEKVEMENSIGMQRDVIEL